MKITVLGSNGWYESPTGATTCLLIQIAGLDLVFDAGTGFNHLANHIDGTNPIWLLLSHTHYDHLIGLNTLSRLNPLKGFRIFGQPGTQAAMQDFFNPKFTTPLADLPFPVDIYETRRILSDEPRVTIEAQPLAHSLPCQGYRIEYGGKVVTICSDTSPCQSLIDLARGANLFFCEATIPAGRQPHPNIAHLTPAHAARTARESGARELVLMHFDPSMSFEERVNSLEEATAIFPNTKLARDGLVIDLA